MIKFSILFFWLFLSFDTFAQQDYLVTEKNDTLYGFVSKNFAWFGNKITVRTKQGKMKFHYNDIKAYQQRGKKYMKAKQLNRKGKELNWHCLVVTEGKLTLLAETVQDGPAHFLYYEGVFYEIVRRYFPSEIWEKLTQCKLFAEKFADSYKATGGKLIALPRDLKKWAGMVAYYNEHCMLR